MTENKKILPLAPYEPFYISISDNQFTLFFGAWGQKYTGTYDYQGGIMTLHVTNGYTSGDPHTGRLGRAKGDSVMRY